MPSDNLLPKLKQSFFSYFGAKPEIIAYAPGRAEILGNHTDYNEGFVLSAAINKGIYFLASKNNTSECILIAENLKEKFVFNVEKIKPEKQCQWANYIKGVLANITKIKNIQFGIKVLFYGNLPTGAGLSSSAALEISSGLAISALYKIKIKPIELAKIGQRAEHEYVGAKCGLLDQISSIFGKANNLILTDFRSLKIENVPFDRNYCFLICNTGVKHNLVESEYNERRRKCEKAAKIFARILPHPVKALRDVSWDEWEKNLNLLVHDVAYIAAHPIGENQRVLKGKKLLKEGNMEKFGRLMFESHESSRKFFKNSCKELDFIVDSAQKQNGVLGARLSGGGFGGSAVILCEAKKIKKIASSISESYSNWYNHKLEIYPIFPSDGASIIITTT